MEAKGQDRAQDLKDVCCWIKGINDFETITQTFTQMYQDACYTLKLQRGTLPASRIYVLNVNNFS